MPAEPVDYPGARLVFTSHPATIADRIEMTKQERIVDLAGARLVAAGIVGELDMGDARQMLLQGARDFAFHDLHVVDVVLDEDIVRADIGYDLRRLFGAVEEEAGDIDGVDRFDQEPDPLFR